MSLAPFIFIPLLAPSYSYIGVTAHYLFLWGIKAFWIGKPKVSIFFTKGVRWGVVKKTIVLEFSFCCIHFLLGTSNCSLLFFFLTYVPAPESKHLPWNHSKTCFGGGRKASEAVRMSDECYWGERANLLMKTMDDAKYCKADMQKVFGIRVVARSLFEPSVTSRWAWQWKNQKTERNPKPNPIN